MVLSERERQVIAELEQQFDEPPLGARVTRRSAVIAYRWRTALCTAALVAGSVLTVALVPVSVLGSYVAFLVAAAGLLGLAFGPAGRSMAARLRRIADRSSRVAPSDGSDIDDGNGPPDQAPPSSL